MTRLGDTGDVPHCVGFYAGPHPSGQQTQRVTLKYINMATVHHSIRRPSTSLLLTLLLVTPALAQDERPPISIPQPERQLATPASGSPLTIVQVNYHKAVKERDYLSLAVQELVTFTRIATQLEAPLHSRVLTLDDPKIADALMLYMTGFDGVMQISDPAKRRASPTTCAVAACSLPRIFCP